MDISFSLIFIYSIQLSYHVRLVHVLDWMMVSNVHFQHRMVPLAGSIGSRDMICSTYMRRQSSESCIHVFYTGYVGTEVDEFVDTLLCIWRGRKA